MPKVNTQTARFDRYRKGLKVPANTKSGFKIDKSKPADETDSILVKKGETYYTWKFRYGSLQESATYPKPQQLTQSEFMIEVYGIHEDIESFDASDLDAVEGLEDSQDMLNVFKDDILERANTILEELEEKQSNLEQYAGLSEGPAGPLIQERIEAVQSFIEEWEALDFDLEYDEEEETDNIQDIIDAMQSTFIDV